ncbi:MAG: hypothetical protein ACOC22_03560 [bacterium]
MILFLRDQSNRTIVDIDIWNELEHNDKNEVTRRYTEISVSVDILRYSIKFLQLLKDTDIPTETATHYVSDIHHLSELRGWLWEQFYMTGDNDGSHIDNIIKEVNSMLDGVAKKYNLVVVQD